MIAKIKTKLSTKVLALVLLTAMVFHVMLYGIVAFNGEQRPSTISNIFAALVLVTLVVILYYVSTNGELVAQSQPDNERE